MNVKHIAAAAIMAAAVSTQSAMAKDNSDFNYVVDRFADIEVLRYKCRFEN